VKILEVLSEIPDPRRYNAQHELTDILFVVLVAMLCGATSCTDFEAFAEGRLEFLRQFVPLKRGAPSHDTFSKVMRALEPDALGVVFQRVTATVGGEARVLAQAQGQVAVDGKGMRRAYERGRAHMPPFVVTVFECASFLSLAQQVAGEGGEAEAAIRALRLVNLEGALVSADALHCHRRFTEAVKDAGGDYLVTIKGNQSKLAKEAAAALDAAADFPAAESQDSAHDRDERRSAIVVPFLQSPGKAALAGLVAVARIQTWRVKGGVTGSHEIRDLALSWIATPSEALQASRAHWAFENRLHWRLDVLMGEDNSRSRKQNAAANLGALRRLALNALQADPRPIPFTRKRLKARWSDQELLQLMTHLR
jgi:predicted transposase YbfD/YdcC